MPWKWLNFFLQDDAELARIGREYGSGRMLTGEIKAELVRDSWPLRCAGPLLWLLRAARRGLLGREPGPLASFRRPPVSPLRCAPGRAPR